MAMIRCKACGRLYDYQKQGMCPKCGAYNRPPRRERVEADGTVHEIDTPTGAVPAHGGRKVYYEEKTCYEHQTRVSRRGGVQHLTEQLQTMGKKKRDALIGVAVTVLVALIPLLRACVIDYDTNYDTPEPVAPAEEAALPEYGLYQPMRTFEVLGKTAKLTEIFITQDEVFLTIEGLAVDAPEPRLGVYAPDGSFMSVLPVSISEWGDGVEYTYDRTAFDESDAIAGWALQFETPVGMTEVDLTGYFDF